MLLAAREALCQAGSVGAAGADRTVLVAGSSLAAAASSERFWRSWAADGPARADPRLLRSYDLERMLRELADALGAGAGALLVTNACAAGASSIALAADQIRIGRADRAIALGFDSLDVHTLAGFAALKALTADAIHPFAAGRSGMLLGDGFGALVLERPGASAARPVARLLGCGESSDAHHMTQPHPEGAGASLAMERALADAAIPAGDVDLVKVHATATPANDLAEYRARRRVFGERLVRLPLAAWKPALGHTLGGAGSVEAILAIQVLRHQYLPPTLGLAALDPEMGSLDLVPVGRPARVRVAMSNAFGFGGSNASLLFGEGGTP